MEYPLIWFLSVPFHLFFWRGWRPYLHPHVQMEEEIYLPEFPQDAVGDHINIWLTCSLAYPFHFLYLAFTLLFPIYFILKDIDEKEISIEIDGLYAEIAIEMAR